MSAHTINMLIAALGGEGGGVLTQWLIDVADAHGWHCQSTSLAGVAQRTGATIYYLEFMPRTADQPEPVMSLFPAQGDINIAVTSEIAEAGRMLSRGFITPDKTTLITSDHRVYGITEKSAATDGTANTEIIMSLAQRYAQRFIHFDIDALVKRQGTVISAGLFGAIAGAKVLPFSKASFLSVIQRGKSSAANIAAFEESFAAADNNGAVTHEPEKPDAFILPAPTSSLGQRLLPRVAELPQPVHEVCYHAVRKLLDYQDADYAESFLAKVAQVAERDHDDPAYGLARETARWLALWMAFEDVPRVAQLKLRPSRDAEIRSEVKAEPGQALKVTEFFHPRVEEVAAILPKRAGEMLLNSETARRTVDRFLGPRKLRTDTVFMQIVLRMLASARRFRRSTLGYAHEHVMIDQWFGAILAAPSVAQARAIADSGRLVKGYGATRHRTCQRLLAIVTAVEQQPTLSAQQIRQLYEAAIQEESPSPFNRALAKLA